MALLTLALGIGANTAIFSFVDGLLLKPLPYANADRIVRVLEKPPRGERNGISTLNFLDWQKDNAVFDFMAAQSGGGATLTGVSDPIQLRGARVSAHYFDIFGIKAALGRTFRADEDQPGKDKVVVLSHVLWVNQFGADPSVVEPDDSPRQRAAHGRRRPARGQRLRPRLQPAVASARVRAVEHDAQLSLADVVCPAQAGRVARAGQSQHERDRGAHREGLSRIRTRTGESSPSATAIRSSARSFARRSSC